MLESKIATGDLIKILDFDHAYSMCPIHGMSKIYPDDMFGSVGIILAMSNSQYEVLISNDVIYIDLWQLNPDIAFRRI